MRKLHRELQRICKYPDRLQSQLEGVVTLHGTVVDEATYSDLFTIIQNEGETLWERALPNTFQEMFWKQQVDAASRDDTRGMRWHPTMIKWCIYLRHLSLKLPMRHFASHTAFNFHHNALPVTTHTI